MPSSQEKKLLLLLLCCLSTMLLNLFMGAASSNHVLAPNMSSCHLPLDFPSAETPYDCCAPSSPYPPRLFRPNSSSSSSLRIRHPAYAADAAYAAKLARAYMLMQALPPDDPRSFVQQANIHCAYCNTVYNQMFSSQVFQVHNSWLFFPFHRWYLYFHERILARLLGDDSFALPFWNYDHPDGASIPWLFSGTSAYAILSNALRDSSHEFPATVAIDFNVDTNLRPPEDQRRENANAMYRALIRDATTPESFFGWDYRHGDAPMPQGYGFGTVESQPHNSVHRWVGNRSAIGWKDMGSFYSAAHDPIFYAHHAQIDRLWDLWKAMPGHKDIEDEDYRNAEFLFYNEEGELVRVKAGDASNSTMLGYVYKEVETPWMNAIPEKRSFAPAKLGKDDTVCNEGEAIEKASCSIAVGRDPEVSKASPWLHDHLGLTVYYNATQAMNVDVYLNLPAANATTDTGCKEYVTGVRFNKFCVEDQVGYRTVRLDIKERLVDLNLTEESSIIVTLVPRTPPSLSFSGSITLLSAFVEYTLPHQRWDDCVGARSPTPIL
ncbi:hypothetical protein L7F22_010312 [Adiantum nelumboides]|nr:hypothetical protein [Adiantum nelumboides]